MRWNIVCDFTKIENKFSSFYLHLNIICHFSKIENIYFLFGFIFYILIQINVTFSSSKLIMPLYLYCILLVIILYTKIFTK